MATYFRCLGAVLAVKEFGHGTSFDRVDRVVIEPGRVAGNDDVVRLIRNVVFRLPQVI